MPNKNIFGVSFETPTDLETSAPNLDTDVDDSIPPVIFNPFAPSTTSSTEEIETFDMFGNIDKPAEEEMSENQPVETPTSSIGDQINNIRSTVRNIEANGYKLEMEEYDFEDLYQIVIKIKK